MFVLMQFLTSGRVSDDELTIIDRVFTPTILNYNYTTTYGGSTRYGPGNHEGDPAYDRTKSFDSVFAGLGIGMVFLRRERL